MTDKDIIIDGIIVSDCKHFYLEAQIPQIPLAGYSSICCEEDVAKECKDKPNCYFKQLARKTQECEELKEKLACQININNHLADYQVTANKLMDYYRKALEEIEGYVRDNSDFDKSDILTSKTGAYDILDIINKAKGE